MHPKDRNTCKGKNGGPEINGGGPVPRRLSYIRGLLGSKASGRTILQIPQEKKFRPMRQEDSVGKIGSEFSEGDL